MGDVISVIETIFVGAATLVWLLVTLDLLFPAFSTWDRLAEALKSGVFSAGGPVLITAAFFLGSAGFVMADEFFNESWPWLGIQSDADIRRDSYTRRYKELCRGDYPPLVAKGVRHIYRYGEDLHALEQQLKDAKKAREKDNLDKEKEQTLDTETLVSG